MGQFATWPELGQGVDCLIVSPEDMMKLETIELLLQLPNLLSVCHNVGVTAVRLPHDFVYNELRVTTNVKPLNPELSGDVQVVDECLVFRHIIGREEVQSNHVEEPVSLGGDQHYASPGPIESKTLTKIHAPVLLGDRVGGGAAVSRSVRP
jgi:hypothetical protein